MLNLKDFFDKVSCLWRTLSILQTNNVCQFRTQLGQRKPDKSPLVSVELTDLLQPSPLGFSEKAQAAGRLVMHTIISKKNLERSVFYSSIIPFGSRGV